MVLRYHILHYFWYKQPLIFKLSNCCTGDRCDIQIIQSCLKKNLKKVRPSSSLISDQVGRTQYQTFLRFYSQNQNCIAGALRPYVILKFMQRNSNSKIPSLWRTSNVNKSRDSQQCQQEAIIFVRQMINPNKDMK